MNKIFLFLLCLTFIGSLPACAASDSIDAENLKSRADSAYLKEKYDLAIDLYKQVLEHGQSARVAYNLGNSYYRNGKMANAVLWYERALLLNPGMDDARVNLDMALSNTVDQIEPAEEFFLFNLCRRIANITSSDGWACCALIFFALLFVCVGCYLFVPNELVRRFSFYGVIAFLILVIVANCNAWSLRERLQNRTGAVVMSPAVKILNTPSDTGKEEFTLHEGTRVEILDSTMKDWYQIELSDGRQGWISTKDVEVI